MKKSAIALLLSLCATQAFADDQEAIERFNTEGKIAAAEALSQVYSAPNEAQVRTAKVLFNLPRSANSVLLCRVQGPIFVAIENTPLIYATKGTIFADVQTAYMEVKNLESATRHMNRAIIKGSGATPDFMNGKIVEWNRVVIPNGPETYLIVKSEKTYAIEKDSENNVIAVRNSNGEIDVSFTVKAVEVSAKDESGQYDGGYLVKAEQEFKNMSGINSCSQLR
ncbi:MAG: hypothetical protein AB7H97_16750 [Pseudobdellovibrionaceae bacterium]